MPSTSYTAVYDFFREQLKKLREKKGLTQSELADRLGVPQSYVSKYETGERRLDLVETVEICRTLGSGAARLVADLEAHLKKLESSSAAPSQTRRTRRG